MRICRIAAGVATAALALASSAGAATYNFSISGPAISGEISLTATPDTVVGDPVGAYTIQTIGGTFSDANIPVSNATITGLIAINPGAPVGAPAPVSLSFLPVTNAPPADQPGDALSYDNLYYPGGAPITCADYPFAGGNVDVYGVMFTLDNGDAVDFYSNGGGVGMPLNFGAAVISLGGQGNTILDYVSGGLQVPEPANWALMLLGFGGLGGALRRRRGLAAAI